ncbi:MAG: restriction endonuclease subunit S [Gammaproteobacteria bacterium]|nr:restriction endonuclease subunit S [Gammaproteobacteria bacterium]
MAGDWLNSTLGDVLTLQRGFDLPAQERQSGPYPIIASTGEVGTHTAAMVKAPGVVIGRSGSLGGGQYVTHDFWPLNTTLWVKDFKGNDKRFCYYLLKSIDFTKFNVGGAVPTLNRNHIHPLPVRVPSDIAEQRAIAHILGTLDDKIELNRRTNETLEAMARAIFKSWFVDFDPVRAKAGGEPPESICRRLGFTPDLLALFPNRLVDSELGEIPEGWEQKRVDDVLDLAYGKALKASDRLDGPVPVYGSGGLTGFHNEHLVDGPGIIVGRKGTVGSLYWEDRPFYPIDTVFYVVPKAELSFCFYLLRTLGLDRMNTDAAVPGLNRNNVYRLPIAWVPDALRQEFDRVVKLLRNRMFSNEKESQTLAAMRDSVLPKLVSGELPVPVEGET